MRRRPRAVRAQRLAAIRDILRRAPVRSQADLALRLRRRGFEVTQATLSRDLRRLGVVRRPGVGGGVLYGLPEQALLGEEALRSALAGFLGMSFSGNLGVARTLPGYAASVAAALDGAGIEGLLATLAGDDTVLVIPADGVDRGALRRAILKRLPELDGRIG